MLKIIKMEHFKLNGFLISFVHLFASLFHKSFVWSVLSYFCGKFQFRLINIFWQKKISFHRKMSIYLTCSLEFLTFFILMTYTAFQLTVRHFHKKLLLLESMQIIYSNTSLK